MFISAGYRIHRSSFYVWLFVDYLVNGEKLWFSKAKGKLTSVQKL
jgi:hypothetical protein